MMLNVDSVARSRRFRVSRILLIRQPILSLSLVISAPKTPAIWGGLPSPKIGGSCMRKVCNIFLHRNVATIP